MEKYIAKLEARLSAKHSQEKVKKIKRNYRIAGGVVLGVGLIGFCVMFALYLHNFLNAETETAFTYWLYEIPFVILIVCGAVLARIGDRLLKESQTSIELKEDKKKKK